MSVFEDAKAWKQELSEVRRYLHQYPEASMKEFKTTAYIREYLTKRGISWIPAGETGTVAIVQGKQDGKVIGLRGTLMHWRWRNLMKIHIVPEIRELCMHVDMTDTRLRFWERQFICMRINQSFPAL